MEVNISVVVNVHIPDLNQAEKLAGQLASLVEALLKYNSDVPFDRNSVDVGTIVEIVPEDAELATEQE